jgi:outer membrane protein assembly factor BamB
MTERVPIPSRRQVIQSAGSLVPATAIAGCSSGEDNDPAEDGPSRSTPTATTSYRPESFTLNTLDASPSVTHHGIASPALNTWACCTLDGITYTPTHRGNPVKVGALDHEADAVVDTFDLGSARVCTAAAAADGVAYFASSPRGTVHRFDPETESLSTVATIQDEGRRVVWSLEVASDGTLYAGTGNGSRVYEIDPDSGDVTEIGPVADGEKYAYDLVVTDSVVYVGIGNTDNSGLYEFDRDTHEITRRYPDQVTDWVRKVRTNGRYLAMYLKNEDRTAIVDREAGDLEAGEITYFVEGPLPSDWALGRGSLDETDLFYPARPSQIRNWPEDEVHDTSGPALYALNLETRERRRVQAIAGARYNDRSNHVVDGKYVAVRSSGSAVIADVEAGESEAYPLAEVGMEMTAGTNQEIGQFRGNPVTARRGALFVHDVEAGTRERVSFGGEAKRMVEVDGQLYLGKYPGAIFKVYDGESVRTLGEGEGQSRPYDLLHNPATDTVLMGTQPDYGAATGGSITALDLETEEVTTHKNVIADQSIYSLTADGETIFAGGGTRRGIGAERVTDAGKIAQLHQPTMEKAWELTPVDGADTIWDVDYANDRIVGMADSTLFAVHVPTQTVEDTIDLDLVPFFDPGPGDRLYGVANLTGGDTDGAGGLLRIDPSDLTVDHVTAEGVYCFAAESTVIEDSIFYVDDETWNLAEVSGIGDY